MLFDKCSFVDKAVQTEYDDPRLVLHRNSQVKSPMVPQQKSDRSTRQSNATILHSDPCDGPSMNSDPAYISAPPDCRSIATQPGSSRPPSIMRSTYKQTRLLYSRPPQPNHLNKRVVSMTEILSGVDVNIHDEPQRRIVSLPEHTRHPVLGQATKDSPSVEYYGTSPDTSYRSSRDGSIPRRIRDPPLSDIPQTPSPPSSPDSILIIGNDAHVPVSFLRQKTHSHSSTSSEDDDTGEF